MFCQPTIPSFCQLVLGALDQTGSFGAACVKECNNIKYITDHSSSSAAIWLGVLPLVSMSSLLLIVKKIKSTPPKKKNTGKGLPTALRIQGVAMVQMAAASQFIDDAAGTYLWGISSGTQGQTTGPIDRAYTTSKNTMKAKAALTRPMLSRFLYSMTKRMAMMKLVMLRTRLPITVGLLRPNLVNITPAKQVAASWKQLAISEEWRDRVAFLPLNKRFTSEMTTFMPLNCCMKWSSNPRNRAFLEGLRETGGSGSTFMWCRDRIFFTSGCMLLSFSQTCKISVRILWALLGSTPDVFQLIMLCEDSMDFCFSRALGEAAICCCLRSA